MTEFTADGLAGLSPASIMKLFRTAPESQLKAAMQGEGRRAILDAIFAKMPELFRPDRAGSTNAVIHWNITGGSTPEPDRYQLVIADGACSVSPVFDREARLAVTLAAVEFLKLISGRGNPAMMLITGKVKVKGDLGLATSLTQLFDDPSA